MPNTWMKALKIYNDGKKWSVPKKGSKGYNEIKKIQQNLTKIPKLSDKQSKKRVKYLKSKKYKVKEVDIGDGTLIMKKKIY